MTAPTLPPTSARASGEEISTAFAQFLALCRARNTRLLASAGSVCTLYRLLTVPWVRVVRSDVTAVAWENTAVCA